MQTKVWKFDTLQQTKSTKDDIQPNFSQKYLISLINAKKSDEGDMPILTAICFIGQKFLGNSKLTEDAKTFGFKILFAE